MRKVLIVGERGYLARAFAAHWRAQGWDVQPAGVDVTDREAVARVCHAVRPDVVLNAAGKTHSAQHATIDGCEESVVACTRTYAVNASGAGHVAHAAAQVGATLLHLSSGCIFDGDGVFAESSTPNPQSWYAETKIAGEAFVRAACPDALILRLRMPFDTGAHPRNLLTKLAGYETVVDAPNSLTAVSSLLDVADRLLRMEAAGTFHVVNPGPVSPYALACRLAMVHGGRAPRRLTPAELNGLTVAPRSNCVLATHRLEAMGITLPPAAVVLDRVFGVAS